MKTDFLTPVGRLVQGDPFEAQTKNQHGQPLVTLSGQPTQKYFIAVAFPKTDPQFPALYAKLVEVARASFPALFDAAGNCTHPKFSWKLIDGDGIDDNGKRNATKDGFAGNWVLKFSSSFAPRCFRVGHYAPHEQLQDPKSIPRGYYVRVAGTIEGNANPQKPGLYVNLNMVELAGGGPGDLITSGPDASAVFGGAAPVLPAGVAPTPVAALPGMPQMPMAAPMLPMAPALPVAPMAAPALPVAPVAAPALPVAPMAVAPNPGFLAVGATAPLGIPAVPAVAPAVGLPTPAPAPAIGAMPVSPSSPQMTAAAGGFTREQYHAQGWTDEQLRAQGMMV